LLLALKLQIPFSKSSATILEQMAMALLFFFRAMAQQGHRAGFLTISYHEGGFKTPL
jgi:hypothetical protein